MPPSSRRRSPGRCRGQRRCVEQADLGLWRELVERPLGEAIEKRFRDDTVRGVVATDALIGTFARMDDPSLIQNRCFLYHLIGNGTGEWRVPVGGMGAVTDALAAAARGAGAELVVNAEVTAIRSGAGDAEVDVLHDGEPRTLRARFVLANVAPWVLAGLLGEERDPAGKPVGAQLKVNFLLDRLPRLATGADPRIAFAGTLHLGEDYPELERAYADAAGGQVPSSMPGEVYCHSLTDPSILGQVPDGTQTLTYFGLHLPATLFDDPATRAERKELAVERAIASLDKHLVDPIESVVAHDAGRQALHRGEDTARHRGRPGHAGRAHLPRRPELALGGRHRRARHARGALGRGDQPGGSPLVRLRRTARGRGLWSRRPQRRSGSLGARMTIATMLEHQLPGRVTVFGPDFPFALRRLAAPSGRPRLGSRAGARRTVAVVGAGLAGLVAAYELMELGLRPVVYEPTRIGGRLRSHEFEGANGIVAELGGMRFPVSGTSFFHYADRVGLASAPFPNPLTEAAGSTVIDIAGQTFHGSTLERAAAGVRRGRGRLGGGT